ncbi:Phage integrase family protein [Thermomonospora echinospora]|uniref:Phage integrase family protein n=1 Tax=Thermomonospora echinospora TaxID=1992 RepID=A0A1H6E9F0_9ACTN|nr:tyrosine-type recombinase/integrase [Thermomonospora echinospora]SEG93566.1 Phage integrase family protein [Thermomonospora echinospora]
MGYAKKRTNKAGKTRYTAVYIDLQGRTRSAGTFSNKKDANTAWQDKEVELRQGKVGDPKRGQMTLRKYATEVWLPNHRIEPKTREKYTGYLDKHILPELGPMKMADIFPEHIRQWITSLQSRGVSPWVIQSCKNSILNALFTTALNDQITYLHPCRGVRIPTVPSTPRTIITPEQFDLLYQALGEPDHQLLVETDIETGLRWGELIELRVKDLDLATRMLTVSRKATEISPRFHPEGKRFLITRYPKDKEFRRLKLSKQITEKLKAHINAHRLGSEDLLFARRVQARPPIRNQVVADPAELGLTPPNAKGRQYQHGTISAYNAAPCRCDHCRAAYARYRAERRAAGKDNPRTPRTIDDEHIPRNWFRRHVWRPALKAADLGITPRVHDLRHSHASWLLHGGADLQIVKDRLGHASIVTTQKYLHTLPEADDAAIDAFTKIRQRSKKDKKRKQRKDAR